MSKIKYVIAVREYQDNDVFVATILEGETFDQLKAEAMVREFTEKAGKIIAIKNG